MMQTINGAPPRVLVVEDEQDVRELMALHLKREGFETTTVDHGEDALALLNSKPFELIVLDWMLPGLSGLEICKKIRSAPKALAAHTPILMVTARADTSDIVLGLEMGADDYITKPFEVRVFLARARSLVRRAQRTSETPAQTTEDLIVIGSLRVDLAAVRAFCEKEEIPLTPSEFKLLSALVIHRGRALSRERLIDLVQGEGVTVVDRAIDTHVFGLRKKLGPCADVIETIRGVGYRVRTDD